MRTQAWPFVYKNISAQVFHLRLCLGEFGRTPVTLLTYKFVMACEESYKMLLREMKMEPLTYEAVAADWEKRAKE